MSCHDKSPQQIIIREWYGYTTAAFLALVEFAQFCNVTFKGLGTNDCIDLKIWHKPFKHKENRRGASFFMQILLSLLNIIDLACKPKKH